MITFSMLLISTYLMVGPIEVQSEGKYQITGVVCERAKHSKRVATPVPTASIVLYDSKGKQCASILPNGLGQFKINVAKEGVYNLVIMDTSHEMEVKHILIDDKAPVQYLGMIKLDRTK
ncbi:hypothetical protein [Chitinophaga nivalis]|uniref:Carboxypeptidase regulatory-like domain-containing protein n=1 Tax=Chitinophaga nivalis TaxID=2991709 RepID=A0ABT3IJF0_9BACT|nr:hypothetical protein [Chitinophaga nivalis]MCW3466222.1 hypothetical protein [Chitinophaga nivalis]MCW3484087.1 hypothetical protein [Chitinophaga nivalis]